jgi:hypothetical protein
MPAEPVTSLLGSASRATKRARVTPRAVGAAVGEAPERRVLEAVFVIDHAFVARGGRRAYCRSAPGRGNQGCSARLDPGAPVSSQGGRGRSAAALELVLQSGYWPLWRSLATGSAVLPHQICHRITLRTNPFPTRPELVREWTERVRGKVAKVAKCFGGRACDHDQAHFQQIGVPQRDLAPQDRAPTGILSTFGSFVEIL